MREISLIFTRDFDFWQLELTRQMLVDGGCVKLWGKGLSDQIIHFTGRSFEWWRYTADMAELRDFIVSKPLTDPIFSGAEAQALRREVTALRALLATDPNTITDPAAHFAALKSGFLAMYPHYPIPLFVPGPWRELFVARHRKEVEPILERLVESREISEGLVKEVTLAARRWLEPLIEAAGYPSDQFRLLTVAEVDVFVAAGALPDRSVLAERAKGFVHIKGELILDTDWSQFLHSHELTISGSDTSLNPTEFKGAVASPGPILRGPVRTVLNSYDVSSFPSGAILVTSMTSPEYLPAMKQALAIVTDEGGVTSHAAIVSRELGIPCVIGTKIATKVLKDGDLIEVDATTGIIRRLNG